MNLQEKLTEIKNYTIKDLTETHDYLIDYEHLHLEECLGTTYRHPRLTNYTDQELPILYEAYTEKAMEVW